MAKGIAKIEGVNISWAPIHDGNRCVVHFGDQTVIGPLPTGYVYADSEAEAKTPKIQKYEATIAWYAAAIAAGFDTGLGFRLRLDDAARNEFDALLTSINTQLITGVPIASIEMPLISGLDESEPYGIDAGHALTAAEFIAVFSAGKVYYASLLGLRTSYLAAIKAGNFDFTPGEPIGGE